MGVCLCDFQKVPLSLIPVAQRARFVVQGVSENCRLDTHICFTCHQDILLSTSFSSVVHQQQTSIHGDWHSVFSFASQLNQSIHFKMADWQNGLCGCFNDCGLCIISYIIPCYTFGKNAEALGESCFLCGVASMFGLPLIIFGALHRQKLREMKGIDGSLVGDIVAYFCCPLCAMIQMGQEIRAGVPGAQTMAREWEAQHFCIFYLFTLYISIISLDLWITAPTQIILCWKKKGFLEIISFANRHKCSYSLFLCLYRSICM